MVVTFINMKSAFDNVSYSQLALKVVERGGPVHLSLLLCYWDITQGRSIRW